MLSPDAATRPLELLAETLGPAPELWKLFDVVSVPEATVGEALDLALLVAEGPAS